MKNTKSQLLKAAVKNKVLLVGPMATTKPPDFGPTIYVDGGIRWFSESAEAKLSLGDGDSSHKNDSRNLDLKFSSDKDISDLGIALKLLPPHALKIWLWGFLGGDKAHELINLGSVAQLLEGREATAALFDHDILIVSAGACALPVKGEFSLISFSANEICLNGCKYSLKKQTHLPAFSSLGLSNHSDGVINVRARRPLMFLARAPFGPRILDELVFHHTDLP